MNPHDQWCINSACPASGQAGQGTITIHSQKERQYHGSLCGKTFSSRRRARQDPNATLSGWRWLDGVVSTRRDQRLIERLVALIAASAIVAPLLVGVDGFSSYIHVIRFAFRTRVASRRHDAPRKVLWEGLCIGQVVKHTHKRRVVEILRRLIEDSLAMAERLMAQTPGRVV